jgi:hypothetical protein
MTVMSNVFFIWGFPWLDFYFPHRLPTLLCAGYSEPYQSGRMNVTLHLANVRNVANVPGRKTGGQKVDIRRENL